VAGKLCKTLQEVKELRAGAKLLRTKVQGARILPHSNLLASEAHFEPFLIVLFELSFLSAPMRHPASDPVAVQHASVRLYAHACHSA
jgi:hypothetical protein